MKKVLAYAAPLAALVPSLVSAQSSLSTFNNTNNAVSNVLTSVKGLINMALVVLAGVAVIVFIWGIIKFLLKAGDADARKEARNYMIYGVIAFAVIAGLYGLANVLLGFFGINPSDAGHVPGINFTNINN